MSIARLAVGSKATFAKSITRVVSTQKPGYHPNLISTNHQHQQQPQKQQHRNISSTPLRNRNRERDTKELQLKRRAYSKELAKFRELLTLTGNQKRGDVMTGDIKEAMNIYTNLKETEVFTLGDIAILIQGIHSSSRTTYKVLLSDMISSLRSKQMQRQSEELLQYLEIIAKDIRTEATETNMFGMMQLFTCFLTMRKPKRGLELWHQFVEDQTTCEAAMKTAKSPKVVGAILDLMVADNKPIEEIESIYNWCRQSHSDINLEHALARAYIFSDHTTDALKLFQNIVQEYPNEDYYLGRIHETFIGDSTDIEIALSFYQEAVNKSTPYVVTCHPSAVHRLMERVWASTKDLDKVYSIWRDYLAFVPPTMKERNFNILTYSLFTRFFEKYPEMSDEGYNYLKNIISTYSELRRNISILFLNTLLSRVNQWRNTEVIMGIIETYDMYNLHKTFDSYRIILNSLEHIDASPEYIEKVWVGRMCESKPLEQFDWGALAKACSQQSRNDLFAKLYNLYGIRLGDRELERLVNFLNRPYAGSAYAATIVANANSALPVPK